MNKKIITILIFAAGVLAGGAGFYLFQAEKVLSSEEASNIAIDFINNNIEEGATASLVDVFKFGGIYKIHLQITGRDYESYITDDGKFLFPTGINLSEQAQQPSLDSSGLAPTQEVLADFAKCLTDKGAKFYGAFWCGYCKNQKEMFGEAAQYLPYVECSAEDGKTQLEVCKNNNIASYPTWVFPDDTRQTGEMPLETLAEKTGCRLP